MTDKRGGVFTAPAAEPMKVVLSKPVTSVGELVTEFTLREPTGADLRGVPLGELTFGHMMDLVGRLAVITGDPPKRGLTKEAMDSMAAKDVRVAVALISPFF